MVPLSFGTAAVSKAVPGDSRQDFRIMELDCAKAITYVQRSTECSQQPPLVSRVQRYHVFHAAHRLRQLWGVSGNVGACTPVRYIVRSSPRLTAPPRKFLYNTSSTRFATRAHFLRVPGALGMPPPPPSCAKRYTLPRSAAQKYSGRLVGVKESLRVLKRSIAPSRTLSESDRRGCHEAVM